MCLAAPGAAACSFFEHRAATAAGHTEYRGDAAFGMMEGMKTIQLRRYALVDGEYDAFVDWWRAWMPRVRPAAGFAIEFAYGVPESNEFVWAVSVEGDTDAFLAREREYLASAARAEAFHGVPQRVASQDVSFVVDVA